MPKLTCADSTPPTDLRTVKTAARTAYGLRNIDN